MDPARSAPPHELIQSSHQPPPLVAQMEKLWGCIRCQISTPPINSTCGRYIFGLAPLLLISLAALWSPALAQSQLLESVKQNPARAKALCSQFQGFNAQGLSATSSSAVSQIARQENLSPMDSEVIITYVIGLYCPDVR